MSAIQAPRPSPESNPSSPTPAPRAPWLALLLIAAGLLVANRRPLADAVAGVTRGPLAALLGGRSGGGGFAGREAWPVVPAPGPMVILGPAAPAGVGVPLGGGGVEGGGGGRRAIGVEWGPGEVGD